ncbi:MAG: GTPase Era [Elusimicrobia bacterium]|nr:GTPase Era [Elusimicrobiota bacterium]
MTQVTGYDLFRAGFAAITGLPNTGKSTLLNALCGTRLSIISPKPQTTRNNILGILNAPGRQAVFVDTPGLLEPRTLFEKSMSNAIKRAATEESDLVLLLAEPGFPPPEKMFFFERFRNLQVPLYLVINKIDLAAKDSPGPGKTAGVFSSLLTVKKTFFISALAGTGVGELKKELLAALPLHPPYYPQDQLTDRWERFYAAEIIREQLFNLYAEELPYASAVEIEVFRETPGLPDYVMAVVHVAKKSQKPIIIGKGGRQIRILRGNAQAAIGKFLGRPVKLQLTVKVTEDWQNSVAFLRKTGV